MGWLVKSDAALLNAPTTRRWNFFGVNIIFVTVFLSSILISISWLKNISSALIRISDLVIMG